MNHSTDPLFDSRIAAWLEEDPNSAPDQALETILAAVPSISQRRRLPVPWRFTRMSTSLRLAAAAVIGVVALGVIYLNLPGRNDVGGPPTAAPSPSTTPAPSPTATPGAYTSRLYGYSVDGLTGWAITPASVQWPDDGLIAANNPQWFDLFIAPDWEGPNLGWVGVAAQPIPDGMTDDEWLIAYAERQATSGYVCSGPVEDWVEAVVGTLSIRRMDHTCDGRLPNGEDATGLNSTEVVFVVDSTGYVMNGNREGIDTLLSSFQPG